MWEFDHKEGWVLKNWCFLTVVLEKTSECPLGSKDTKPVNPKGNQPWILFGRTDAETEGHLRQRADSLEKTWCWERLKAEGEEGDRGWDGWMASPTQWTWTWANSRRWWGTGETGVLLSMESWRLGHDLVTEQQQQADLPDKYSLHTGGSWKHL